MPRTKEISAGGSARDKVTKTSNTVLKNESKTEQREDSNKVPDLSMFKFEKKPHIKIEFEKNSPDKDKGESKGLWEPPNWREFLVNLRNMRSNNDAPVDTMGCHMTMDENAPPEVMRYQSLIALMLSSQTKDQVTFAAMERLRGKGLTVDNVLNMSEEELGKLIYPVGFWKTKVKYIKKTSQTLKDQYDGDIPDSVDKLCKLTGVGPKMAHICMQVAWNKTTGIGVDTHVHRISNRIGWVKKPTPTPEDTRKALQSWLPFDLWSEVNHLMVGFGQTICQPINPICHECLNRDICPSSGMGKKSPNKKSPLKQKVKEEMLTSFVEVDNIPLAPPGKQKLTLKKKDPVELPVVIENILTVEGNLSASTLEQKVIPKNSSETETVLSVKKSPNKRKATPKKVNIVENKIESGINESEEISMHQLDTKKLKKSPNKKKLMVKNENAINNTNITNNDTGLIKRSPNKRRGPSKQELIISSTSEDDGEHVLLDKKARNMRAKKGHSSKMDSTNKAPEVKRKSPRNKCNIDNK